MALLDRAVLYLLVLTRGGRMFTQVVADHPVVVQQGIARREDVHVEVGALRWPLDQMGLS